MIFICWFSVKIILLIYENDLKIIKNWDYFNYNYLINVILGFFF